MKERKRTSVLACQRFQLLIKGLTQLDITNITTRMLDFKLAYASMSVLGPRVLHGSMSTCHNEMRGSAISCSYGMHSGII